MHIDRRQFFQFAALAGIAASGALSGSSAAPAQKITAIAFDAFPVFDPRPVFALCETLFPGKGAELSAAWRTRQFEYQWLRTLTGRYADFWQTTEDALRFSAQMLKLELTPDKRDQLMGAYLHLKAWPDAPAALRSLKASGYRIAFVSNMTGKLLDAGIANAGLEDVFDYRLSSDRVKAHKPDPRAYQMAIDTLALRRDEIAFVAFAGWDAVGAKSFGYTTFWVNRLDLPHEELGVSPDAVGRDLNDLVRFMGVRGSPSA
jgi:2-haloacid dehalogenase